MSTFLVMIKQRHRPTKANNNYVLFWGRALQMALLNGNAFLIIILCRKNASVSSVSSLAGL